MLAKTVSSSWVTSFAAYRLELMVKFRLLPYNKHEYLTKSFELYSIGTVKLFFITLDMQEKMSIPSPYLSYFIKRLRQ